MLDRLHPKKRLVLVLFELEGVPVEEISRIVGCPTNTVWSRLHHARLDLTKLAAKMSKKGTLQGSLQGTAKGPLKGNFKASAERPVTTALGDGTLEEARAEHEAPNATNLTRDRGETP